MERYFRELKRLKLIYEWNEAKTLNMALHGLKGRADDFFALRQGKDQMVLDFAGIIKQHQGKADVGPGTVLAVFLEGLKGSIAKQRAIQDPKTFEEAVAIATRLESLDRVKPSKVTLNLMGTEQETEGSQVEGVTMFVEKLGLIWPASNPHHGIRGQTVLKINKVISQKKGTDKLRETQKGVKQEVCPKLWRKLQDRTIERIEREWTKKGRKGVRLRKRPITLTGSV